MRWIKCPVCELNYIDADTETCCSVCSKSREIDHPPIRRPWTVKNEPAIYRGCKGYKVYFWDVCVGIAFSTADKRTPAYGHVELAFYEQYRESFGEWHRVKSNGDRIRFDVLEIILQREGFYTFYIDN